MRHKGYVVFMLCGWLLTGCGEKECSKLERALALSGDHRAELEKVLEHFSQRPEDSLQLKSAVFLIENMPGHRGPDSSSIRRYKARIDTLPELSYEERKILLGLPSKHPELCPDMAEAEDIHTIKAEDLIRHISRICRMKDSCTWLRHLDFDLFCEYLLPYRIENEWLEFPPDTLPSDLAETMAYANRYYDDCQHSPYSMCSFIQRESSFAIKYHVKDSTFSKLIYSWVNKNKMNAIRLRRLGIPLALDYVPILRPNEQANYWYIPIDARIIPKSNYKIEGISTGKVYRQTFSYNPAPVVDSHEVVPPFFRNPFQKDVTDLYLHTADVELSLSLPQGVRYAYLAMYDGKAWCPVAYSEAKGGICRFSKLGKDCVYLPVCYPSEQMQPLAPPFILRSNGEMTPLIVARDSTIAIQAERLCAYVNSSNYYNENMVNSYFECSDDKSFKNSDTVYVITKPPHYRLETIHPSPKLKKRYWRLMLSHGYCVLSELHYLNAEGEELKGEYRAGNTTNLNWLTDNDPETSRSFYVSLGTDFGKPVQVATIRYMSSNDGYNIWPGNEYELFYFRDGEWHSAGRQKAEATAITFRDVPANTLYQIIDNTNRKQGSPFVLEKGRVRFF